MRIPGPDSDGVYRPADENELAQLIGLARQDKANLRLRGARHSVTGAYIGSGAEAINVSLDKMRAVTVLDAPSRLVRAQGGCNLDIDPYNPYSNAENSLVQQLAKHGWALPDLGGITHQTVAGFISTGSSGGSLIYDLGASIRNIHYVDGEGQINVVNPGVFQVFSAVGCSMGLFGIVFAVDFVCVPNFGISGQEAITNYADCEIDLFGAGSPEKPSLQNFLYNRNPANPGQHLGAAYSRILWWPQKGVERVTVWKAGRMEPPPDFEPKPYSEMLGGGVATLSAQDIAEFAGLLEAASKSIYDHRDTLLLLARAEWDKASNQDWLAKIVVALENGDDQLKLAAFVVEAFWGMADEAVQLLASLFYTLLGYRDVEGNVAQQLFFEIFTDEATFESKWFPLIVTKIFVVADKDKSGADQGKPQVFSDWGWHGLPMDNGMDDELMPTRFTELWIPLDQAQAVMRALKTHFEEVGMAATGTYTFEIYATSASPFCLSPAFGQDVLRIDIFWFGRNAQAPDKDFYPQFWELLRPFDFRFHWGKFLSPPKSSTGVAYRKARYSAWDSFMSLRAKADPDQIFLSDYWREHLGIAPLEG